MSPSTKVRRRNSLVVPRTFSLERSPRRYCSSFFALAVSASSVASWADVIAPPAPAKPGSRKRTAVPASEESVRVTILRLLDQPPPDPAGSTCASSFSCAFQTADAEIRPVAGSTVRACRSPLHSPVLYCARKAIGAPCAKSLPVSTEPEFDPWRAWMSLIARPSASVSSCGLDTLKNWP